MGASSFSVAPLQGLSIRFNFRGTSRIFGINPMTNSSGVNGNDSRFVLLFIVALTQLAQPACAQPDEKQAAPKEFALRVVDPDGEAIGGAEVTVILPGKWAKEDVLAGEFSRLSTGSLSGKTDAEGGLVVRRPKEARSPHALIQLSKSGYVIGKEPPLYIYDVPPGQDVMEITLFPALSLGGVVVNEQGQPIPDVEILRTDITLVESAEGIEPRRDYHHQRSTTRTDKEGNWKFDEISASFGACEIRLFHPEYVLQTEEILLASVNARDPDSPLRSYVLKRGQSITGLVKDERNQAIVGAQVRIKADDYVDMPRTTTTDEQGAYQLTGLKADSYQVAVYAPGKAALQQQVSILPETRKLNFSLREGRKLKLQVVDKEGRPIANARVSLSGPRQGLERPLFDPPTTETDAEGRWQWNEAPEEEIFVDVYHLNWLTTREIPLIASDEPHVIALPKAIVMQGRVIDAETEQPIERFKIALEHRHEGDSQWSSQWYTTSRNGEFTSQPDWGPSLSGGRYRIEAEGYEPAFSPSFQSDAGAIEHEFRLVRQSTTQLIILSPDSRPVENAQVVVVSPVDQIQIRNGVARPNSSWHPTPRNWPTTNAQGMADVTLPEGDYELLALHDGGFAEWRSSQGPLPDRLTLTPWAQVEGTFRLKDQPLAGINISLWSDIPNDQNEAWKRPLSKDDPSGSVSYTPPFAFQHEARTDDQGKFRMERVYPGSGFIGLDNLNSRESHPKSSVRYPIRLKPGESRRIDLGGVGRAVVGQLTWKDDESTKVSWDRINISMSEKPLRGLARRLIQSKAESRAIWASTKSELDGSFRIDDVPPGEYLISIAISFGPPSFKEIRKEVTVPRDNNQPITEREPVNLGTLTLEPK